MATDVPVHDVAAEMRARTSETVYRPRTLKEMLSRTCLTCRKSSLPSRSQLMVGETKVANAIHEIGEQILIWRPEFKGRIPCLRSNRS